MPTSIHTLERQQAPKTGPISADELDHILGQSWPRPGSCSGSCNRNQGRGLCDCTPDVEDQRDPMTDSERMWLGVALGLSALTSVAALSWALPTAWAAVKRWI